RRGRRSTRQTCCVACADAHVVPRCGAGLRRFPSVQASHARGGVPAASASRYRGVMLAAYVASTSATDPFAGLVVGERPAPEPREHWTTVDVAAASLNHHDLWSL